MKGYPQTIAKDGQDYLVRKVCNIDVRYFNAGIGDALELYVDFPFYFLNELMIHSYRINHVKKSVSSDVFEAFDLFFKERYSE